MTKQVQSGDIVTTIDPALIEEERAIAIFEASRPPILYPDSDLALLTHEQKLHVVAYKERYQSATETLDALRLAVAARKLDFAHLAVTGIFIEQDVEMPALDVDGQQIIDTETGEVQMTLKDRCMLRVSAARFGRSVVENEVYYSTLSPIVKRFLAQLIKDFNAGHMGDFEDGCFVPVEVYNKVYNNGHSGIGVKVVEEL